MPLTFITGPVRSGKSRFAERLAGESGRPVAYVATARRDADDAEWEARIAHHRARRPASWETIESGASPPGELAAMLRRQPHGRTLVVDSFGTWLASAMHEGVDPGDLERLAGELVAAAAEARARTIVVGEEVGWGIVPIAASARLFRDVAGRAQQRLAARAVSAYLVVAGYAIDLHRSGTPVDAAPSFE